MKKRTISTLIALLMLASASPVSAFTVVSGSAVAYSGEFTDISPSDWYFTDVTEAYTLGLISGKDSTTFAPDKSLTIAETIKLAASVHQYLVNGKINSAAFETAYGTHWYDGYVNYAYKNGIVTEDYPDYNANASRAQVAVLFSRAIKSSGIDAEEINMAGFGSLPDVSVEAWYAGSVYRMYRLGIMTGDASRNIKPESDIKRREIAAVIMRMIDSDRRVKVGESTSAPSDTPDEPETPAEQKPEVSDSETQYSSSLILWEGNFDAKSFSGITGFAAEFDVKDALPSVSASYSLDLVNSLILEQDNISFRLYTGSGYEALGIVRGWMNDAARGKNGSAIREKDDVHELVNETAYLWIDGERVVISELWYADHGGYTTYAFYFDEKIDPSSVQSLDFAVGRMDREVLESASLSSLADAIEKADVEDVTEPETAPEPSEEIPDDRSDTYKAAVTDAVANAADILFEYETKRCAIIYGRGLYGRESDDYRLIFVFRDGTTQTVAAQKVDDIRVNTAGNVLYYNLTGPDGLVLQYGINFGE